MGKRSNPQQFLQELSRCAPNVAAVARASHEGRQSHDDLVCLAATCVLVVAEEAKYYLTEYEDRLSKCCENAPVAAEKARLEEAVFVPFAAAIVAATTSGSTTDQLITVAATLIRNWHDFSREDFVAIRNRLLSASKKK